jgi:hypothetical protein
MIRGGISLGQDEVKAEMARTQAIQSAGKSFITLKLLDYTKNRIQGAIILNAIPYEDSDGMVKYHFEEKGGPINFVLDEFQGAMYAKLLDCEHNRRFLASMLAYNFWEIEDKQILSQIKVLADEMAKKAIKMKEMAPKSVERILSDEELDTEMAKLQGEQAKRKIARSQLQSKKMARDVQVEKTEDQSAVQDKKAEENQQEVTSAPIIQGEKQHRRHAKRGRKSTTLVTVEP